MFLFAPFDRNFRRQELRSLKVQACGWHRADADNRPTVKYFERPLYAMTLLGTLGSNRVSPMPSTNALDFPERGEKAIPFRMLLCFIFPRIKMPNFEYEALTPKFLCICWRWWTGESWSSGQKKSSAVIRVVLFSGWKSLQQPMALKGDASARMTKCQQRVWLGTEQAHVSCVMQMLGHMT